MIRGGPHIHAVPVRPSPRHSTRIGTVLLHLRRSMSVSQVKTSVTGFFVYLSACAMCALQCADTDAAVVVPGDDMWTVVRIESHHSYEYRYACLVQQQFIRHISRHVNTRPMLMVVFLRSCLSKTIPTVFAAPLHSSMHLLHICNSATLPHLIDTLALLVSSKHCKHQKLFKHFKHQ